MNKIGISFFGIPVTLGRIMALLSIPFILPPYALTLMPWACRRYRLTNKRVVVERGMRGSVLKVLAFIQEKEERTVSLDRFDAIDIVVLPGQEWYHAGDLVFRLGPVETFRLQGVPRPETFRHTCLKAHQSHVGVQKAQQAEAAA